MSHDEVRFDKRVAIVTGAGNGPGLDHALDPDQPPITAPGAANGGDTLPPVWPR